MAYSVRPLSSLASNAAGELLSGGEHGSVDEIVAFLDEFRRGRRMLPRPVREAMRLRGYEPGTVSESYRELQPYIDAMRNPEPENLGRAVFFCHALALTASLQER